MNNNKSNYLNHLTKSQKTVSEWPEWKRNAMGSTHLSVSAKTVSKRLDSSSKFSSTKVATNIKNEVSK